MSVSAVGAPPAPVAALQAEFAALTSQPAPSGSLPAPTDPFSVLLDAASTSTGDPSTADSTDSTGSGSTALGSTGLGGTGSALSGATTSPYDPLVESSEPSTFGTTALDTSGLDVTASTPSGAAIVAQASQEIGVPYVWGGDSPSAGFDCSGLVQYTFAQLGVAVPRTAAEQEQVGTPVASLADAEPGDLLFFEPGQNGAPAGEAGHVAIYIGDDKMIAAPETGQDVQVQTVPGTPLAIRRVTVPVEESAGGSVSSAGTVQMGNVAVPSAYAGLIEQASAQTGTPASFLAAILQQESGFNPDAVSSTGAEGIAQIEPGTAASNGIEPFSPSSAIPGAADLLAQYHAAFGSWSLAAAAYNAGPGAVEAAGGVPVNGQTPEYVDNVMAMAGATAAS